MKSWRRTTQHHGLAHASLKLLGLIHYPGSDPKIHHEPLGEICVAKSMFNIKSKGAGLWIDDTVRRWTIYCYKEQLCGLHG